MSGGAAAAQPLEAHALQDAPQLLLPIGVAGHGAHDGDLVRAQLHAQQRGPGAPQVGGSTREQSTLQHVARWSRMRRSFFSSSIDGLSPNPQVRFSSTQVESTARTPMCTSPFSTVTTSPADGRDQARAPTGR